MTIDDDIEIIAEALYRAGYKRMGIEPIYEWRDPQSNICHDWFRSHAEHAIAAAQQHDTPSPVSALIEAGKAWAAHPLTQQDRRTDEDEILYRAVNALATHPTPDRGE